MGKITSKSSTYRRRIGAHHFAHLRAVAEGLSIQESAHRYLAIDHGHQAVTAHRTLVEQLRTLSRRRGDRAWRLLGLSIRTAQASPKPSLEDFIAERELDGWSESEVQEMYAEAWPEDRKASRRYRLRERQLLLLRELETVAAERAAADDSIDGWFDPATTERLARAQIQTLGQLQAAIARGGRWWRHIPAIGATKAGRISHYLATLLTPPPTPEIFVLAGPEGREDSKTRPTRTSQERVSDTHEGGNDLEGEKFAVAASSRLAGDWAISGELTPPALPTPSDDLVAQAAALTPMEQVAAAQSDADMISAWVAARAGSSTTATSYRREALRFLLWLNRERGKGYKDARYDDCLAYMSFLEHLPPGWISRQHSEVLGPGWAPFRGPLSLASRRQAVIVLGSFFAWLVDVGYLALRNPWMLVNRRTGDDADDHALDSRAFTPQAWSAILDFVATQVPSPSKDRIQFLLQFGEATGLRASELVNAKLRAFRLHKGRLAMQVHGKGSRNRLIAVPGQAAEALQRYLMARGIPDLLQAPPDTSLLDSLKEPGQGIGYQALYQTLKRWLQRAIRQSALPDREKEDALRASPHWLRHTFGTRALERKAPLEVVQRQLGHADPRTTMRYAQAQLERLQAEMDQAFGAPPPSPSPSDQT